MRLGSIEFPPGLLAARRHGRLVVFAGAGVSRLAPSCLPDFEGLVAEVAGNRLARLDREPPDRFLGRLGQVGIPVHRRAALSLVGRQDSRPNELHRLLVQLFPSSEELRLVTTNFDRHFEAELAARWPQSPPPIYAAPALPVGGGFLPAQCSRRTHSPVRPVSGGHVSCTVRCREPTSVRRMLGRAREP